MRKIVLVFVAALNFSSASPLLAQDFDKGLTAYKAYDYATALKEWRSLAEQGHAKAQNNLGTMYEKGNGVPQNYAQALKWYTLAAEQGNTKAQSNLGVMYLSGNGVSQDYVEAFKWYTLAAELGLSTAQYNAGIMYDNGIGVSQDYAQALILLDKTLVDAKRSYEVVSEKTGEVYEVIVGTDVCDTIEVINGKAISFIGGAATGFSAAAKTARPSKSLLIVHRAYDEFTVIKGVGVLQRSVSFGFIASKVVPAIPTGAASLAGASAVVYLGTTGVCYVTSPEAKEHLGVAKSFSFSALDVAKEKAEAIIQYIRD